MSAAQLVGTEYLLVRLLLLAVAVVNAAFGLSVYRQKPESWSHRMFAAFGGSIALWCIGLLFIRTASSPPLLDRLAYVGASLLVLCLLALVKSLPHGASPRVRWDFAVLAGLGAAVTLLSFTPLVYRESIFQDGRHQNFYGPLYPAFGAYVFACMGVAVATLWRRFRRATGLARLQLLYLLLGFVIPSLAIVSTNLVVPLLVGTAAVSSYGPLFTIPMIAVMAHAMIRHRLMDIRIIVRAGTVYALTGLILAAPAVALVVAVDLWVPAAAGRLVLGALVVGAVAVLNAPLRNRLDRVLNGYVYRERYAYHEVIREAMERLGQLRHLDTLLADLATVVDRAVRPDLVEVWLPAPDGSGYRRALRQATADALDAGGAKPLPADSALVNWLTRHRQPLLLDDPARAEAGGQPALGELSGRGGELAVLSGPILGLEGWVAS